MGLEPPSSLGDVLPSLRLAPRSFLVLEASTPWARSVAGDRVVRICAALNGRAQLQVEWAAGPRSWQLGSGDVAVIPSGAAFHLGDGTESAASPPLEVSPRSAAGQTTRLSVGGSGPGATLLLGTFSYENDLARTLMDALPETVYFGEDYPNARVWLNAIALEVQKPHLGANTLIARLTEVMLLYVIRVYVERGDARETGWLAALGDAQIGRALAAVHRRPADAWDVAGLAATAAMSRAAFYRRFCEMVGEPPLAYLRRWRMHRASEALRDPSRSVMEIARSVGYDSEASFSRAFKRHFGRTPSAFRSTSLDQE